MGRLDEVRVVDPVLTNIARGYKNEKFIAEVLFPNALVPKEAGKVQQFTKEAFKIYNTERMIRSKSNMIIPEPTSTISYLLDEHDLSYPIDYRERDEADGLFKMNLDKNGINTCVEGIAIRKEKIAADIMAATASYAATNIITLSGTSKWSSQTTSDPVGDVNTGKDAIRGLIGIEPNTMVIGYKTYMCLKEHPAIMEKIKYTMKGIVNLDLLREIFDIETIAVGRAVYASDAGTFSDLWSDNCYLAYVGTGNDIYEPSFGYTLHKSGMPVADKYIENGGKVLKVRATDIFQVKALAFEAAYAIIDCK